MCGIYGRLSYYRSHCTIGKIFNQLQKLKHRGYDGMGAAITHRENIYCVKGIQQEKYLNIETRMGIGHTRYKTKGGINQKSCQPLIKDNFALVHNGHIEDTDYSPDSLLILSFFSAEEPIFDIVKNIMKNIHNGAYSCIVMIPNKGLVVFRDPRGIRPLIYHHNDDRVIIASESRVVIGPVKDVRPGECIIFKLDGTIEQKICSENIKYTPCIFEYIYFAHKDSIINGIHVYKARQLLGKLLSEKIHKEDYDVISPVPKTSCVSAKELSRISGIYYQELLTVKEGRTFILPQQSIRNNLIREKFILDTEACRNKKILLVDDSIVRGSTMESLIKKFKQTEYKKLGIASCAPPIFSKNIYGINITCSKELLTHRILGGSVEKEIAEILDVDEVIYQDLSTMKKEFLKLNPEIRDFECSMFYK